MQFGETDDAYELYAVDGPIVYRCVLYKQDMGGSIGWPASYSQQQNDTDKADFEANFKATANQPLEQRVPDGRIRIASEKTSQSRVTLYSHDWTDPTTWYTTSAFLQGDTATDSGDHLTYDLSHQDIIDTYHGNITGEDFLKDSQGRSYRVAVYVNGTQKTEQDPHVGSGGDYKIDYRAGKVIFLSALQPTDVVTADYHYKVDSTFIVAPLPGKNLRLDSAEVQFTTDITLTDAVVFQPYGLVDVFAPQLMPGIPSGTKIPLGDPVIYKTMTDYQNDAVKLYPTFPAISSGNWRGVSQPMVVLDWDYQSATTLIGAAGMEIHIFLQHHTPFTGTYATATFYCISEAP